MRQPEPGIKQREVNSRVIVDACERGIWVQCGCSAEMKMKTPGEVEWDPKRLAACMW